MDRSASQRARTPSAGPDPSPPARRNAAELERREGLSAEPPEVCAPTGLPAEERPSARSLDSAFKAQMAALTQGVTPFGLSATFADWAIHAAASPAKHAQLAETAAQSWLSFARFAARAAQGGATERCVEPMPHDHRFEDEAWRTWPWSLMEQSFLLTQRWWHAATNEVDGLERRKEQVVSFVTRQLLDTVAPSNFVATNPQVARLTREQAGANLAQGARNFLEDWDRLVTDRPPVGAEDYRPGRDVATTEGRVVRRTRLMELIQYAPRTEAVASEPLLIVPAWIMKYYILDLSPDNSLIGHLVDQGFTVFCLSWRNPTAEDRDMGMDDYFAALDEALDAVNAIVPERKIHAVGYCLGGTLMSAKAAQMARDGDDRLASLTLFATQTDFHDPGELQLFVSESEVSFLEHMMWDRGYLDSRQMAGAFHLLRSADLIWSRYIREYLMGRRQEMFDLMAWNADSTRMPYRMHSEYLRRLFLENELAHGRYEVKGAPVAIEDIRVPIFCVSTTSDHIAPWRSVYLLHLLSDAEITFVLTNGGHNAGIVSEPGHEGREYSIRTSPDSEPYMDPDAWRAQAEAREGSWWPELTGWLRARSSGESAPPAMGAQGACAPKEPAPGTYVFQR